MQPRMTQVCATMAYAGLANETGLRSHIPDRHSTDGTTPQSQGMQIHKTEGKEGGKTEKLPWTRGKAL